MLKIKSAGDFNPEKGISWEGILLLVRFFVQCGMARNYTTKIFSYIGKLDCNMLPQNASIPANLQIGKEISLGFDLNIGVIYINIDLSIGRKIHWGWAPIVFVPNEAVAEGQKGVVGNRQNFVSRYYCNATRTKVNHISSISRHVRIVCAYYSHSWKQKLTRTPLLPIYCLSSICNAGFIWHVLRNHKQQCHRTKIVMQCHDTVLMITTWL